MKFLKPEDFFAFLISCFLGFLVTFLLPAGPWAVYASMLVSYHLFLAWLVIDAGRNSSLSLPMASAIFTHLACLVLVVGYGMGREIIPYFWLLRYGVAGLAVFERKWLFSGGVTKEEATSSVAPVSAQAAAVIAEATADDQEAWIQYLANPNRPRRKPGISVQDEYEQWLLARVKKRSAVS